MRVVMRWVILLSLLARSASLTCASGFFALNATYCKQCAVKTCPDGFYSGGCSNSSNSTCLPCTNCAQRYKVNTSCSATADTVCTSLVVLPPGTTRYATIYYTREPIKETITVANMTLSQCACAFQMISMALGNLYMANVFLLSCTSGTTTIECPNYVCPCSTGRWLLQADAVQVTLVYFRYSQQQITNTLRTLWMQRVISDSVVVSSNEVVLNVKTTNYDEVAPSSFMGMLISIMAAITCAACCWKFSRRKTPPPNTLPYKIIKP